MLKQPSVLNLLIQGSKKASLNKITNRRFKDLRRTRLGLSYLATHNKRRSTKDMIALLLSYGEQSRRNTLPKINIKLAVRGVHGNSAVKIQMQA